MHKANIEFTRGTSPVASFFHLIPDHLSCGSNWRRADVIVEGSCPGF